MKKGVILYVLAALLSYCATSCNRSGPLSKGFDAISQRQQQAGNVAGNTLPAEHEGTYAGSPPCFTGKQATELILDDNRYTLKNTYIIQDQEKGFEQQGEYSCSRDGGRLHLKGNGSPTLYLIGNDVLIPLDSGGKPLSTSEGELFCLEKVASR